MRIRPAILWMLPIEQIVQVAGERGTELCGKLAWRNAGATLWQQRVRGRDVKERAEQDVSGRVGD